MKKLLLGTMALIGLLSAGVAQAADMPIKAAPAAAPPPFNWTGFYIGAHAGGAWGTAESEIPFQILSHQFVFPLASHNVNGFVAGGQVGYNWQVNPWLVFGIEGQFSWTDAKGSTPCVVVLRCTDDVRSIFTLAGRLGYALDRTMIYIKGGVAWADIRHTIDFLGVDAITASTTRTGAMIGTGIEHAFAPNWSAKIEYNFMDFDRHTLGFGNGGCDSITTRTADVVCDRLNVDFKERIHLIKFGLNYRFNWGAPAAPVAARY
jgi:outer membrane immunogenic protein